MRRTNPIMYGEFAKQAGFVPYLTHLSESEEMNKVVGVTSKGVLAIAERVAKSGYYEFHPVLVEWDDIDEVEISRTVGLKGLVLGAIGCTISGYILPRVAADGQHGWPLVFLVIVFVFGAIYIFGALRNKIAVQIRGNWYRWMSAPLQYRRTLSYCAELSQLCEKHDVPCVSHVHEAEEVYDDNLLSE
ncbi:MAG: hypothetical protein R3C18_22340 [Planctomycetaceae bacterium]